MKEPKEEHGSSAECWSGPPAGGGAQDGFTGRGGGRAASPFLESMSRLFAFTVDLDPLSSYCQIHGLDPPAPSIRNAVLLEAVPRFLELFDSLGIRATFFVVASDLDAGEGRVLREAASRGHELANHTLNHRYDLLRLPHGIMEQEVVAAHEALGDAAGEAVVGFRAPGYGTSPALLRLLERLGYRYDSSMFSSAPYYLAKAAVMARMALAGRKSGAIVHDPRMLLAPLAPYRPDPERPWQRGKGRVVELPVTVLPVLGLPLTGTLLVLAGRLIRTALMFLSGRLSFVNLECHGIDLIDCARDGIPEALVKSQPDLRVSFESKLEAIRGFAARLSRTHRSVTLKEAACLLFDQREAGAPPLSAP